MRPLELLILLSVWIILAAIPMGIAKSKGRGAFGWYLYGLFLFPIAVVHAVAIDSNDLDPVYKAVREQSELIRKLIAELNRANSSRGG